MTVYNNFTYLLNYLLTNLLSIKQEVAKLVAE